MKNILIIVPSLNKGGMERQLVLFLNNHNTYDLKITLALLRNKVEYPIPHHVETVCLNKKSKFDLQFYKKFYNLLKKEKWDIIHTKISGLNEQVMFFCGLMGYSNLIIDIRSSGKRLYKNYFIMKILFTVYNKYSSWKIVTNSMKAKNEIHSMINQKVNASIINNGIDVEHFISKKLPSSNKKFTLTFVGRIQPVKNIEIVIKTLSKLQNKVVFEIYGNIENTEYYEYLKKLCAQMDIAKIIHFNNATENIVKVYQDSDLIIVPSFLEGSPNVLLEAMACEKVCLISKGANSDCFLDERFTFDEMSEQSLLDKITMVMEMEDFEKSIIGKNNRDFIIRNFSIQSMINKYTGLYHSY